MRHGSSQAAASLQADVLFGVLPLHAPSSVRARVDKEAPASVPKVLLVVAARSTVLTPLLR